MSAPTVKVYTSANCSFCSWAKKLLDKKQASYEEIRVDLDEQQREQMVAMAKKTSVPQIFIGEHHVGGYQEMIELDSEGTLDKMLAGEAP